MRRIIPSSSFCAQRSGVAESRCRKHITALASLGLLLCNTPAHAQDAVEKLFQALANEIPATELELVPNLNDRALGSIDLPRLGGFADLPPGEYPTSAEIEAWEAAFHAGDIGGLILHSDTWQFVLGDEYIVLDHRMIWDRLGEWTDISGRHDSRDRIFVTFSNRNRLLAGEIRDAAESAGYDTILLMNKNSFAGQFYATARHRLAIDSRSTRRLRTDVTEINLLGERMRRNSDSVFRDPVNRDDRNLSRNEPRIFRKTTLGDEFNQPTIEEIVVPGGIALGESAWIDFTPTELVFDGGRYGLGALPADRSGEFVVSHEPFSLHGIDPETGEAVVRQLPDDDPRLLKSLFDLAQRSIRTRSDAVVDLDADRRVSISSALLDTDAGYAMLFADTLPFEYLDYLPVTKSVIIDTGVSWRRGGTEIDSPLEFETGFEVRFLSADRMRVAQTRLALEYEYGSASGAVRHAGNWGRHTSRLRESTDIDGLGEELAEFARHAGWVALFRRLEQDDVPFLKGRYQFMMIDKAGRETPRHFR